MHSSWLFGAGGQREVLFSTQIGAASIAVMISRKSSRTMACSAAWAAKETAGSAQPAIGYNSAAESFFGSLKTERVFDAVYRTRDDARRDIIDYIEMFYKSNRRHSYLGYLSPKDFEERMALKKAALKNVHFYWTTSGALPQLWWDITPYKEKRYLL